MDDEKVYLLAELSVLPDFLDKVKAAVKEVLIPTLQEPGCEALFTTSREGASHQLVFFEVFSSPAAHKFHLEQDHTKRFFAALEDKLAGPLIMTRLDALEGMG
jgi:quinol monooxygenase YgiN